MSSTTQGDRSCNINQIIIFKIFKIVICANEEVIQNSKDLESFGGNKVSVRIFNIVGYSYVNNVESLNVESFIVESLNAESFNGESFNSENHKKPNF